MCKTKGLFGGKRPFAVRRSYQAEPGDATAQRVLGLCSMSITSSHSMIAVRPSLKSGHPLRHPLPALFGVTDRPAGSPVLPAADDKFAWPAVDSLRPKELTALVHDPPAFSSTSSPTLMTSTVRMGLPKMTTCSPSVHRACPCWPPIATEGRNRSALLWASPILSAAGKWLEATSSEPHRVPEQPSPSPSRISSILPKITECRPGNDTTLILCP